MQITKGIKNNAKAKASRDRVIDAASKLFGSKGFHATSMAELIAESDVGAAQIYRIFLSKSDIVIAIVERRMNASLAVVNDIFDSVRRGNLSTFGAIKDMIAALLDDSEVDLVLEIMAESCRNPAVAEHLTSLTTVYRDGIRRLAVFAKPDSSLAELDAYVNLTFACFTGLLYRPVIKTTNEETSHNVACLLMRALGLADQPLV